MPPSSFASALAGNSQNDVPPRDGSSEWSRSRTNGATHTFRRSSTATSVSSMLQQQDASIAAGPPPRYVPPHRNGMMNDMRYSKDQLLDLFKAQHSSEGGLLEGFSSLYAGAWRPEQANGSSSAAWNRSESTRDTQLGPEICWDKDGGVEPLGLAEMDDEERELFATSVNTPLKPPSSNKDGQQTNGLPARKVSMSGQGGLSGNAGALSPTHTRGSARRRETSDSYPFPANPLSTPSGGASGRDDQRTSSPPPSLLRRKTDLKDPTRASDRDDGEEKSSWASLGSLKRNQTGPLSAGIGTPASPWSNAPPSAGLSPMGSFGNFGIGQQGTPTDKRPGLGSGRSESRFKDLLSKDTSDDAPTRSVERKTSTSNLSRVIENESWRPQPQEKSDVPLDEVDEDVPSGSAALAADADLSPAHLRQPGLRGFGTPSRGDHQDDFGFGAFGMTSDNAHGFGPGFPQNRDAFQQSPLQHRHAGGNEPMSPTDTNPYQSPDQRGGDRLVDDEHDGADMHNSHLSGLGGFGADPGQQFSSLSGLGGIPNLGRGMGVPGPAIDRSQSNSTGPNRGFPGLGGLGQLGGLPGSAAWPANPGALGTPGRQGGPFGGLFGSSMAEVQSPSLAGLGSAGGFGGGSRMAGMFPMQDQMQSGELERETGGRAGQQQFPGLGDNQYNTPGVDASGEPDKGSQSGALQHDLAGQPPIQQPSSSASNQPPPPQQRTMVMPDRMRWIYRDPQGQTQGPWSGLEMHDWYKAGFFSPELLVKKLEDPEYEPLAQLIRRIGNSREPFLVPQIGIPHGQPSTTGPNAWAGPGSIGTGTVPPAGAQPPFASSFPSFGTTLTAEQQNALERRKQEEQYLMARQKEHLAQAQMAQRMSHHPMQSGAATAGHSNLAPTGQLHHQHSGQSLHSQPSFGSMTNPPSGGAYQPSPIQAPQGQGFFDGSYRSPAPPGAVGAAGAGVDSLGHIREEEMPGHMSRLDIGNRAGPGQFGAPGQAFPGQQPAQATASQEQHEQQVLQMMQERARLHQEQAFHDAHAQGSEGEQNERLQQFHQLQGQAAERGLDTRFQHGMGKQSMAADGATGQLHPGAELSLTEQVQKAASAQQSPAPQQPGLPQPFPPAPSQSPLPAPAAQRTGRQSVADQLQSEQRDSSQTPSIDTPSAVAPWAKEPAEALKGPSLKEIQEMEAEKAAEAEKLAIAARRAAFQKEMEAQAQATAVITSGLPAGSNWAAGGSPATPTAVAAWAKAAQKPSGPTTAQSMAQIQKEEEARKRRAVAAAAAQATAIASVAPPAGGKSYANLAGKTASPGPAVVQAGGAWTTVGAGGKAKTPITASTGTSATPLSTSRAVSTGVVPTVSTSTSTRKAPTRSATLGGSGAANAQDEFKKWAVGELRPDLNKGISAEDFVATLVFLPAEMEIITEAVHGASSTIDSRHFAEEFIRRKKLADKGIIDSAAPPKAISPHSGNIDKSGGWSEVAKKGPQREAAPGASSAAREEANGNFRVVAPKKKGGKR